MYDDDDASEMSLEMGAEAGPAFEARAQAQSLAGVGPSVGPGIVGEPQKQNSGLRRFSKDHAVSDDVQKRFMIAVENDEKAAKKRVQDMLVSWHQPKACRLAVRELADCLHSVHGYSDRTLLTATPEDMLGSLCGCEAGYWVPTGPYRTMFRLHSV